MFVPLQPFRMKKPRNGCFFAAKRGLCILKVIEHQAMGEFQSGQMGQTVNLLSLDFGGSNPSSPTHEESLRK